MKQIQFYREEKGEVLFNVVKGENYTEKDTKYIREELYKKPRNDVQLIVNFVDSIGRTRTGKYRFLVQKLPIRFEKPGNEEGIEKRKEAIRGDEL